MCHQLGDVGPLRNLTSLQRLRLSYTGVADLSPLGMFHAARGIVFLLARRGSRGCVYSRTSCSMVVNHAQASYLLLLNISAGLVHLSDLALSDCRVSNVTPLQSLVQLSSLNMRYLTSRSCLPNIRSIVGQPPVIKLMLPCIARFKAPAFDLIFSALTAGAWECRILGRSRR